MDKTHDGSLRPVEAQNGSSDEDFAEPMMKVKLAIPDGGLVAWIQVVMGHLIMFNIWGYINSFGVFQTYVCLLLSLCMIWTGHGIEKVLLANDVLLP